DLSGCLEDLGGQSLRVAGVLGLLTVDEHPRSGFDAAVQSVLARLLDELLEGLLAHAGFHGLLGVGAEGLRGVDAGVLGDLEQFGVGASVAAFFGLLGEESVEQVDGDFGLAVDDTGSEVADRVEYSLPLDMRSRNETGL